MTSEVGHVQPGHIKVGQDIHFLLCKFFFQKIVEKNAQIISEILSLKNKTTENAGSLPTIKVS